MPLASGHSALHGYLRMSSIDSDIQFIREPASVRYYAPAYRFKDDGSETYTKKINDFKMGVPKEVESATAVFEYLVNRAMRRVTEISFHRTFLFTAIGHADTVINRATPLYRVGKAVADALEIEYPHRSLTKQPHDSLSSQRSFAARATQIERAAYTCEANLIQGRNPMVIVLDDILTRGDTFCSIANGIMATNPGDFNFVFLSLGKSEAKQFWQTYRGIELCNTHVSQRISNLWV